MTMERITLRIPVLQQPEPTQHAVDIYININGLKTAPCRGHILFTRGILSDNRVLYLASM